MKVKTINSINYIGGIEINEYNILYNDFKELNELYQIYSLFKYKIFKYNNIKINILLYAQLGCKTLYVLDNKYDDIIQLINNMSFNNTYDLKNIYIIFKKVKN